MVQADKCGQLHEGKRIAKTVQWTGNIFQPVELLYALHCMKCFNKGEISLTELFSGVCEMFGFKVKNFSRIFTEIKKRVGDRTIFLDSLKRGLMKYMELSDLK
jgi:hypothetical protein